MCGNSVITLTIICYFVIFVTKVRIIFTLQLCWLQHSYKYVKKTWQDKTSLSPLSMCQITGHVRVANTDCTECWYNECYVAAGVMRIVTMKQIKQLLAAQNVPTPDKPHQCSICKLSYSKLQHLKIHLRTHSGERPYSCKECARSLADSVYNILSFCIT